MRWGLLLVVAAATAGSSCFYDLESYRATEGTGGAGASTTASSPTTTGQMTTTSTMSTTTSDASSSSVGGGLPAGLPHCARLGVPVDEDALDTGQSCNTTKYLWRPNSPFSVDDVCPPNPGAAVVSIVPQTGQQLKIVGATGQYLEDGAGNPQPRKPLQFDECYVSIRVGDVSALGPSIYAYVGLVTGETNPNNDTKLILRAAHGTPTIYAAVIDKDRLGRAGSESAPQIGTIKEFVRVGESNGVYALETKDAGDSTWTTLVQADYMQPAGELYFAFGLFIKNDNASGKAEFADYNLDP